MCEKVHKNLIRTQRDFSVEKKLKQKKEKMLCQPIDHTVLGDVGLFYCLRMSVSITFITITGSFYFPLA